MSETVTETQVQTVAEVRLPTQELRDDLPFFTKTLGFRLDMIYPADNPEVAVLSGHGLRLRIQVTSYDALARMVEAGLGIGVMPRAVAEALVKSVDITAISLNDAWAGRELSICVRAYDALPVAARLLVDSLRSS